MALKSIKEYEGLRLYPYKDSLGYLTVGYGHLVHPNEKFKIGEKITLQEAEELYQKDLAIATQGVHEIMPSWASLDDIAYEVLINLCFNLGKTKLSTFKRTLQSFKEHRYFDAGDNLKDSLWYRQVKTRGVDIVNTLHELGNK